MGSNEISGISGLQNLFGMVEKVTPFLKVVGGDRFSTFGESEKRSRWPGSSPDQGGSVGFYPHATFIILLGMSMECSNYLVSWVVTYLGDLQPTYHLGVIIYLRSTMDIPVTFEQVTSITTHFRVPIFFRHFRSRIAG